MITSPRERTLYSTMPAIQAELKRPSSYPPLYIFTSGIDQTPPPHPTRHPPIHFLTFTSCGGGGLCCLVVKTLDHGLLHT
jgi:hypothetical protein